MLKNSAFPEFQLYLTEDLSVSIYMNPYIHTLMILNTK